MAGRPLRGTLYRRGRVWWLEYTVSGQRIRESLNTKDRAAALVERDRIIGPMLARDRVTRVQAVAARVQAASAARMVSRRSS